MALNQEMWDYLHAVGQQIRWIRARPEVMRELAQHLEDQESDFLAAGLAPEEAARKAVTEMGDPVIVGKELDRLHRPKHNWLLLGFLSGILLAGLWAVGLYASDAQMVRQYAGLGVGLAAMVGFWFLDYTIFFRYRWILPVLLAVLISLIFLPLTGLIHPVSNVLRHLIYLSMAIPPLYAAQICRLRGHGYGTVLLLGCIPVVAGIVPRLAPSIVMHIIITVSMLVVLTVAVWSGWFRGKRLLSLVLAYIPSLIQILPVLLTWQSYQHSRLDLILHPEQASSGSGYWIMQLRTIFETIGLTTGIDADNMPDIFLLYEDLDYLTPRLAASYGWIVIGIISIVALLLAGYLIWRICKLRSVSARLFALAPFSIFLLQFIFNLLSCTGLLSAVPIPLFSYGPVYLILDLALAGLLLSVFRMDSLVRDSMFPPLPHSFWDQFILPIRRYKITISITKKD